MSQAIAGFIPGVVLALVAYVPNAAQQTEGALFGIRALMFLYPLAMCVLAIASIWFIYNLTDEHCVEIQQELPSRRALQETGDVTGATDLTGTRLDEK
jgi:GPH family glycoside/pentoside/hexuronide:cation symporter